MKRLLIVIMHVLMVCNVNIGTLDASEFIDKIEVRSSWKELVDESKITLPKKLMEFGLIDIRPGQEVSINIGYEIPDNGNSVFYTRDVFTGYVSEVNPKTPLEVKCEDPGWLLKRTNINKSWLDGVTLEEIINYILDETNRANPDRKDIILVREGLPQINFKSFRVPNRNAAQVLQKFKDSPYNLAIYFEGHQLHTHLAYTRFLDEVEYFLDQNIIGHNLEYRTADNHKVQVKTVVLKEDNTFTEKVYGQEGGDTLTLTFDQNSDPDIVRQLSETKLKKYAEGYKGTIKTFMVPFARHSMTARVVDPEIGRDERYHIDGTSIEFSDGIVITTELGIKV